MTKQELIQLMTDLAEDCEAASEQFEDIGWVDHASYIQTMASHFRIYKHQIDSTKIGVRNE